MMNRGGGSPGFAVCIERGEYDVDLVVGKIYRVVRPCRNDQPSDIRVVDESGEDYLYPRDWFVPVRLPLKARRALTPS
ncbi:MAG: hypothetical protein ACREKS_05455 [Candidatus Rokuibacteriota bacterium]